MDTVALVELGETLWRVTKHDGEVLGYVEAFDSLGGTRYRAKRMIVRQQRFVPVGEFWLMGDAVDCFR
jgi:DNA-directed RNA polymerase subunit N (RpoN/RPB10)